MHTLPTEPASLQAESVENGVLNYSCTTCLNINGANSIIRYGLNGLRKQFSILFPCQEQVGIDVIVSEHKTMAGLENDTYNRNTIICYTIIGIIAFDIH